MNTMFVRGDGGIDAPASLSFTKEQAATLAEALGLDATKVSNIVFALDFSDVSQVQIDVTVRKEISLDAFYKIVGGEQ